MSTVSKCIYELEPAQGQVDRFEWIICIFLYLPVGRSTVSKYIYELGLAQGQVDRFEWVLCIYIYSPVGASKYIYLYVRYQHLNIYRVRIAS